MKKFLLLSFLVWLCSGCAMTMEKVNINYSLPNPQADVPALNAKLMIGEIQDKRGLEDPSIIIHKTNLNGQTTSGGYQAAEPLPNIVKKALQDYFSRYRVNGGENKTLELYGNIVDFKYEAISGWVSVTLKPELVMKFYLKDLSSNKVVWNETYFGRGTVEKFSGSEDAVNKMLQVSIDDILSQLSDSETLFTHL